MTAKQGGKARARRKGKRECTRPAGKQKSNQQNQSAKEKTRQSEGRQRQPKKKEPPWKKPGTRHQDDRDRPTEGSIAGRGGRNTREAERGHEREASSGRGKRRHDTQKKAESGTSKQKGLRAQHRRGQKWIMPERPKTSGPIQAADEGRYGKNTQPKQEAETTEGKGQSSGAESSDRGQAVRDEQTREPRTGSTKEPSSQP